LTAITKFRTALNTGDGTALGIKGPLLEQPKEESTTRLSNEFEDFKGLEDDPYAHPNRTISEEIWEEFDLVWRTFIFVLSSWVGMPFKLYVPLLQP
jgi:hypothetical protein